MIKEKNIFGSFPKRGDVSSMDYNKISEDKKRGKTTADIYSEGVERYDKVPSRGLEEKVDVKENGKNYEELREGIIRESSLQMKGLLRLTYCGEIPLQSLMDKGLDLIKETMEKDPEGYENSKKYNPLRIVARQLQNLHDNSILEEYSKHKDYLLKLNELLN
jgi:hypothetical protein